MSGADDIAGVLHLLLSAEEASWRQCRACARSNDTIVLLGGAVMALTRDPAELRMDFPCKVAASAADARARGVPEDAGGDGVSLINDAQLVGLIEAHRHSLSWR